jgi:hypothetical protein
MHNDATGRLADEDDDSMAWAAIGNEERDGLNAALAIRCAAVTSVEKELRNLDNWCGP